jgi:hypothetical protein
MSDLSLLADLSSQTWEIMKPLAAAALAGFLIRKFNLDAKSSEADRIRNLSATLAQAAEQGAGIAKGMLVTQQATVADKAITNAAIASGVNFALAMYPKAVAATQLSAESMQKLVTAHLGNALANDPAASVAPPPTAFAPAAPAASAT